MHFHSYIMSVCVGVCVIERMLYSSLSLSLSVCDVLIYVVCVCIINIESIENTHKSFYMNIYTVCLYISVAAGDF